MSDYVNTYTGSQVLYLVPRRIRMKRICSEHRLHIGILPKACKKQFSTTPLGSFKIMGWVCVEEKEETLPKNTAGLRHPHSATQRGGGAGAGCGAVGCGCSPW